VAGETRALWAISVSSIRVGAGGVLKISVKLMKIDAMQVNVFQYRI
jgi:hypothetical protein